MAYRNVFIRCDLTFEPKILHDSNSVYRCENNGNFFMHSIKLKDSIPDLVDMPTTGWFEVQPGLTNITTGIPEALSSCLFCTEGDGGQKSITNTETIFLTTAGSFKLPLFNALFFQYNFTPAIGLRARVSRIVEYGCLALLGETTQILRRFDEYFLIGWKIRHIPTSEDIKNFDDNNGDNENLEFGSWILIPDFKFVQEHETVMCATESSLLQCQQ